MAKDKKPDELLDEAEEISALEATDPKALFSPKELEEIKAEARKNLLALKKKAERTRLLDAETKRLRDEEGLVTGGPDDELVDIVIDLPPFAADIRVNLRPYQHNHSYRVPRHIARSLREIMYRAWRHEELEIQGKKLHQFYQKPRDTVVSAISGVQNAPRAAG